MLVTCKTLRHVVSSAAEAETSGVFINAQLAIPIRHTLVSLGHPQPPTPIKTDNSTAAGHINSNMQQKRSKSWDMRFHWLRDKETQKQMHVCWDKGINNKADYHTKHHPTRYHLDIRRRNSCIRDPLHSNQQPSANMMRMSQQPLSATRSALLKCGL